jgi:hypothetical protein
MKLKTNLSFVLVQVLHPVQVALPEPTVIPEESLQSAATLRFIDLLRLLAKTVFGRRKIKLRSPTLQVHLHVPLVLLEHTMASLVHLLREDILQ